MQGKPQIAAKHFENSLDWHGDLGKFPYGGGTHGEKIILLEKNWYSPGKQMLKQGVMSIQCYTIDYPI